MQIPLPLKTNILLLLTTEARFYHPGLQPELFYVFPLSFSILYQDLPYVTFMQNRLFTIVGARRVFGAVNKAFSGTLLETVPRVLEMCARRATPVEATRGFPPYELNKMCQQGSHQEPAEGMVLVF